MLNWDDIRFFLAIEKAGTTRGAARTLGVTHATVRRRLLGLEEALGVVLFDRISTGLRPTPAASAVMETASQIEVQIALLTQRVFALDDAAAGVVRLSMPEFLATGLIMSRLSSFRDSYPQIEIRLTLTTKLLRFEHRETDIALRLAKEPPLDAIADRVATSPLCAFASERYLRSRPSEDRWVAFDYGPALALTDTSQVSVTVDGLIAMQSALVGGLGVGVLPCFLGDASPELRRIPNSIPQPDLDLWLLVHPDVRKIRRFELVRKFLIDLIDDERELIEGRRARIT